MNLKLYLPLYCLLLITIGCSTKQTAVQDTVTAPPVMEKKEQPKSLLWEINGNGLSEPSYLFGTIHMIKGEDFFLPEGTLSAIDQSSKLVFELDMEEMTNPAKLMGVLEKAYMKGDTTLSDLLTEEDYALVKSHFQEKGLPLFFLERIKPMFLTVFASDEFDPSSLESGGLKSYELEFAEMAKDGNKSTGGLETVDYQISVFDAIPYQDQADMLIEAIKASSSEEDSLEGLVKLYKEQDIYGLYDMMKQDESIGEFEDVLLNQRNKNWIPLMKDEMMNQQTFFAVGAGHLGGKYGVIQLLRDAGYELSPKSN